MTARQREHLFHDLAQLAGSGLGLPQALEVLGRGRTGAISHCANQLHQALHETQTARAAFAATGFPESDAAVIEAGEETGRLEDVFAQLEAYYHQVADARSVLISRSAYPLLVLVLGAILLAIPPAILSGSWLVFAAHALGVLGAFAILVLAIAFGWHAVRRLVSANAQAALRVSTIPVLGAFLSEITSWKFASVLSLYVKAGGGLLKAFRAAGSSCGNALLRETTERAVNGVAAGHRLAEAFRTQAGLSEILVRAIDVGEQAGRLDSETQRAAAILQERSLQKLESLARWTPRILYIGIMLFMAWRIIGTALQISDAVSSALDMEP